MQVNNQTLSPPEGILEAKVSNPQKMCRSEMTCGDHSDPEVGTWVMDDPLESLGDLSLRAFDKIVKAFKRIQVEARNSPSQVQD